MPKWTDVEYVKMILDGMRGSTNQQKAQVIARKLGLRVRQRARDRAEDVNQAAARIVRQATKDI